MDIQRFARNESTCALSMITFVHFKNGIAWYTPTFVLLIVTCKGHCDSSMCAHYRQNRIKKSKSPNKSMRKKICIFLNDRVVRMVTNPRYRPLFSLTKLKQKTQTNKNIHFSMIFWMYLPATRYRY